MQSFNEPNNFNENEQLYQEAARRVQKKTNFFRVLVSYVIINIFMWAIALTTDGGYWPIWITLGWGIGLAYMALNTFGPASKSEAERRKAIEEEMRRMNGPR